MKAAFTSFLLVISQIFLAQVSFTTVGDNLVIANYGISASYPKEAVSTYVNSQYLEVKNDDRTVLIVKDYTTVTAPTSTSLSDLQIKVVAMLNVTGGGITATGAATLTGKTMYWGSNTFTNFPFVGLTGNQTVARNKTFSGPTALTGTLTAGNILPSSDNTVALESSSLSWSAVFSPQFVNTGVTAYGTTNATSAIQFRQGCLSQLVGGVYPTTGNWTVQPAGATLGTYIGERLQVEGPSKLNGATTVGGHLLPATLATYDLGGAASWRQVIGLGFLSPTGAIFGSNIASGGIATWVNNRDCLVILVN